jgi:hypothetical protein
MKRIVIVGLATVLFAVAFAVSSSPSARSAAAAKTEGKVLFKGKTLLFKGGKCQRLTPSGRYQAVIGVLESANPSKTRLLQITITRPAGGGTFKNPAAVVQWRIGTNLWVFNPGVVKLSADMTKGTFSGQVTTGILATKVGAGSGSWTCSRVA